MKIGPQELPVKASQTAVINTSKDKGPASLPPTASATAQAKASDVGVSVSVSALAKSMEKPEVSAPGDIDTGKVATVKKAIQDGTYQVNPEAIADRMLQDAQDMLRRTTN